MVNGDGDVAWPNALADCEKGTPQPLYHGGKIEASDFVAARWESDAAQPLYVGVGADGAWMSEALFVLFGVADGWAASAAAGVGCGDGRELCSCGDWDFDLLRWRMTIFIR